MSYAPGFRVLVWNLAFGLLREVKEIDILKPGIDAAETVARRSVGVDAKLVLPANEMCRNDLELGFHRAHFVVSGDDLGPDLAIECSQGFVRSTLQKQFA